MEIKEIIEEMIEKRKEMLLKMNPENIYANGKIYIIRSDSTKSCYIGSTTLSLQERLKAHEKGYKQYLNGKTNYTSSYAIIEHGDYYITLIQHCPSFCRTDLLRQEGEVMKRYTDTIENRCLAGRTKTEYYEDNKLHILDYQVKYREENKDDINEQRKEYRTRNKETIAEKKQAYYNENKDRILEKQSQHVDCPCGGHYTIIHKTRHFKTIKHQQYIKEQNDV